MGQLADYNINEIAGASSLVIGSLGGLLLIVFKSRCTNINCCFGLWSCARSVPVDNNSDDDDNNQQNQPPQPVRP